MRETADLLSRIVIWAVQSPCSKIFRFAATPNQIYINSRPAPLEGRCATSSTRGGMRWTRMAL